MKYLQPHFVSPSRGVCLLLVGLAAGLLAADPFPQTSTLPSHSELPDPLLMLDGRRVTTKEQWVNERRPELLALFQHYMYGTLPPSPKTVGCKIEREDRTAFGGKATLKEVTVTFGPPDTDNVQMILAKGI